MDLTTLGKELSSGGWGHADPGLVAGVPACAGAVRTEQAADMTGCEGSRSKCLSYLQAV